MERESIVRPVDSKEQGCVRGEVGERRMDVLIHKLPKSAKTKEA